MIKGAIFDIDGTLLDSMPIWSDVGERYLRQRGIQAEEGLGEVLFAMSLEQGAAYLKNSYRLPEQENQIRQGVLDIVEQFYRREVLLKQGAKEFLRQLLQRHIPLALATTGDEALAMAALERLGIAGYFKAIFTCTALGTNKHEALIYKTAAEFLGSSPEETAVFEDVLHALLTAKKAGFVTVAVRDAASSRDKEQILKTADIYAESFSDKHLLKLIG